MFNFPTSGVSPYAMPGSMPGMMPAMGMQPPIYGNYNPQSPSFPYGGNIPANDYYQQQLQASAAIRGVQQIVPSKTGELLGLMDKLGNAFGSSNLSADPAFNAALDMYTGIPGGIPGYSPQGSSFPNFPLTQMNNDPRRAAMVPGNFPIGAYNPTQAMYPYPYMAGLNRPQYLQTSFGALPYGYNGGLPFSPAYQGFGVQPIPVFIPRGYGLMG